MKKYLAILLPALCLTGCSEDMPTSPADGNVTFTVTTTESSRAYGDGSQASQLSYAVYKTGNTLYKQGEATISGLSASVAVSGLTRGETYNVVFWLQAADAGCYTFDTASATVSVSYTNAAGNDEKRDAFFGNTSFKVTGAQQNISVTLKRPFAQLNFATSDLAASNIDTGELTVSTRVSAIANSLNLLNGTVSGSTTATFGYTAVPTEKLSVDGANYDYLAMNYILCNDADLSGTVTFSVKRGNTEIATLSPSNLNLRRNYRTNVLGSILTGATSFTVSVDPGFAGIISSASSGSDSQSGGDNNEGDNNPNNFQAADSHEGSVWNVATLAYLRTALSSAATGETVRLVADLDGGGAEIEPIQVSGNAFTLDGNDKSIKNFKLLPLTLTVSNGGVSAGQSSSESIKHIYGLLHGKYSSPITDVTSIAVKGINVRDLTISNIQANYNSNTQYFGALAASFSGNIENVTVSDVDIKPFITDGEGIQTYQGYVGGLIGRMAEGSSNITDCRALNLKLGGSQVGGLVGNVTTSSTFSRCKVSSCYFYGNNKNYMGALAGYCKTSALTDSGDNLTPTDCTQIICGSSSNLTALFGKDNN